MVAIRPQDLSPVDGGIVNPDAAIIADVGYGVRRATPAQVVDAGAPVSSQAEAEAGIVNNGRMTALRVKQAIDAQALSEDILALPSGAGMVGLPNGTVADAIKWVTPQMYGAIGDGVANDAAAISAAIASGFPIDWGGFAYRITSPIAQTITSKVQWRGNGATIVYDGAHAEYAIRMIDTAGVTVEISAITLDGSKKCNKVFELNNNTSLTTPTTFIAHDLFAKRAKRSNAFADGAAMQFRGAFNLIQFIGGGASDCELPAGQGTSGSVGISGIVVTWYSTTSYARRVIFDGGSINKIYSSDLDYKDDQDGVLYLVPTDSGIKVPSQLVCKSSSFVNCYGRSVKTQVRTTTVTECYFKRSEGFNGGIGNVEVDSQTGDLIASSNSADYLNGFSPSICYGVSGSVARPGMSITKNIVNLDSGTTLTTFAQTFPSTGNLSSHVVDDNKVYGTVTRFFNFLCNGPDNFASVKNNWVQEIALDTTADRALVRAASSGSTSPFQAAIELIGNVYAGVNTVALVRDSVPGSSMFSTPTCANNRGFVTSSSMSAAAGGLKTNIPARLGRLGPLLNPADPGASYFEPLSATVAGGGTAVFNVNQANGALIFFTAAFSQQSYAAFNSYGSVNLVAFKGTGVEVGNTSAPASGTFRIWTSAANQISVTNTDGSSRRVALFVMSVI